MNAARIGAVLIILSMALFYALEPDGLKMIAAITGAAAIGCVNICILIPLIFTLNNTEKLYAIVSANVLIQLISLIKEHSYSIFAEPIISLTFLLCSFGTVLFIKREKEQV